MILFCLPYAGGSEIIYYKWKAYLNKSIQLYPIELRGRGRRYGENFYNNIEDAVEDVCDFIKDKIESDDYAIYGHSMGALIAFESYYKLTENNVKKPQHIFFSGYGAPNLSTRDEIISNLPEEEFIEKVLEMGGTSEEVFKEKEIREIFIPILRNDIKILEEYNFREKKDKIDCNISVLNGNKDDIKLNEIAEWHNLTKRKCNIFTLHGDHFFINQSSKNITDIIKHALIDE